MFSQNAIMMDIIDDGQLNMSGGHFIGAMTAPNNRYSTGMGQNQMMMDMADDGKINFSGGAMMGMMMDQQNYRDQEYYAAQRIQREQRERREREERERRERREREERERRERELREREERWDSDFSMASTTNALQLLISSAPSENRRKMAKTILAQMYLTNKNYENALQIAKEIGAPNVIEECKNYYSTLSFEITDKAQNAFNDGKYDLAKGYASEAKKYAIKIGINNEKASQIYQHVEWIQIRDITNDKNPNDLNSLKRLLKTYRNYTSFLNEDERQKMSVISGKISEMEREIEKKHNVQLQNQINSFIPIIRKGLEDYYLQETYDNLKQMYKDHQQITNPADVEEYIESSVFITSLNILKTALTEYNHRKNHEPKEIATKVMNNAVSDIPKDVHYERIYKHLTHVIIEYLTKNWRLHDKQQFSTYNLSTLIKNNIEIPPKQMFNCCTTRIASIKSETETQIQEWFKKELTIKREDIHLPILENNKN